MALIRNAAMYFVRLDPKHPNARWNPENPTWELQIRTSDPAQRDDWIALKLNPKLLKYSDKSKELDEAGESLAGENILDAEGRKQWRVNLVRRSIKSDETKQTPPKVVNGHLEEIDPNTIGNGSIGNISVFQYESQKDKDVMVSMIRQVQVVKHIVYERQPGDDDFEILDTETIIPEREDKDEEEATATKPTPKPAAPSLGKKPVIDSDDY